MTFSKKFVAGALAFCLAGAPVFAGDIMVKDAYVRSSTPTSVTGAAFLELMNMGETDDRLIAVSSDVAKRVELHTHKSDDNGVMKMMEVKEGFAVPAGGSHMLKRGGDHIMFMGLNQPLEQGQEINVKLTFEKAGDMDVVIPVDHERKVDHSMMNHSHDS